MRMDAKDTMENQPTRESKVDKDDDSTRKNAEHHIQGQIDNAASLFEQGDLTQAMTAFQEVLVESKRDLGPQDVMTTMVMSKIAAMYSELGQFKAGENVYREILQIRKQTLGENDISTAIALANLANAVGDQGRLKEAADMLDVTVSSFKALLGHDHPQTITVMGNLAITSAQLGRNVVALSQYQDALERMDRIFGRRDKTTIHMKDAFVEFLFKDPQTSFLLLYRVLEDQIASKKHVFGENHPETLNNRGQLADLEKKKAELGEFVSIFETELQKHRLALGEADPVVIKRTNNLALLYMKLDEPAKASVHFREVFVRRREIYGDDHPDTVSAKSDFITTAPDDDAPDNKLSIYREILEKRMIMFGNSHPHTEQARINLSAAVWEYSASFANNADIDPNNDMEETLGALELLRMSRPTESSGRIDAQNPINHQGSVVYYPLNRAKSEIRVLKCSIDYDAATVSLEHRNISLDDDFKYAALSYVWGDASNTVPILVNGNPFNAAVNLFEALQSLEKGNMTSMDLWVDSVCIHQTNNKEKSWQVGMMNHVYGRAQLVYCYLGAATETSATVLALLEQLGSDVKDWSGSQVSWDFLCNLKYMELMDQFRDSDPYTAVCDVIRDRPYWNRAWTFQEFAQARSGYLICGTDRCSLEAVKNFFYWLSFKPPIQNSCPAGVEARMWRLIQSLKVFIRYQPVSTPFTLAAFNLAPFSSLKKGAMITQMIAFKRHSSDPRDKIYAALGLCKYGVEPDYDISVEDLYRRVTASFAKEPSNLALIFNAASLTSMHTHRALPSWVPDWDICVNFNCNPPMEPDVFEACKKMDGMGSLTATENKLLISGVQIDSITHSWNQKGKNVKVEEHGENRKEFIQALEFLFQEEIAMVKSRTISSLPRNRIYKPGIPLSSAILQLYSAGRNFLSQVGEESQLILRPGEEKSNLIAAAFLIDVEQSIQPLLELDPSSTSNELIASDIFSLERTEVLNWQTVISSIQNTYEPERVINVLELARVNSPLNEPFLFHPFRTETGYIGVARCSIQSGDIVCVLRSCIVPVVLRKIDGHYQMISLCFVVGLMNGEAYEFIEQGQKEMEDFSII